MAMEPAWIAAWDGEANDFQARVICLALNFLDFWLSKQFADLFSYFFLPAALQPGSSRPLLYSWLSESRLYIAFHISTSYLLAVFSFLNLDRLR